MSERPKNLMRSRCPACGTVFRVTSEQLRLKAGKVRCGQCRTVFNAFDQLLVGAGGQDNPPTIMPMPSTAPMSEPPKSPKPPPKPASAGKSESARPPASAPVAAPAQPVLETPEQDVLETVAPPASERTPEPSPETGAFLPVRRTPEQASAQVPVAVSADAAETLVVAPLPPQAPATISDQEPETLEQTLEAARAAGLVAAREVGDSPGYSRWSAAPVSSGGLDDFDEPAQRPLWPYLLLAFLLSFVLLGQLAYHYRTSLSLRLPALVPLYQMLGVDVPLPREASLISIEASDLQADPVRELFVLNSTLKNRASYDQAWPQLALTLTDVNDRTVARRMISVVDYLGAQHPPAFAAGSDVGVRLWIEAHDIGAAGYRLYLFYPPS